MMNDARREVRCLVRGQGGNEAGMRVISFQDVRNITVGQRVGDDFLSVCGCACACVREMLLTS